MNKLKMILKLIMVFYQEISHVLSQDKIII